MREPATSRQVGPPIPDGRAARAALFLVFSGVGALALLALLEGALALSLWLPRGVGPAFFDEARRRYHVHQERRIVQYLPDCAEYDPELGYRLRPGRCRFENREFDTALAIHALGARGDDASLAAPRIAFAGDSFAMGWGVAQSEVMSARLAELRGERVLNLAVSSHGTARELLMLRRADLSAVRTLVIQYCENDYAENLAFVRGGGRLRVASRVEYETRVREHLDTIRYTPGKLLRRLFPLLWQGWRGFEASEPPEETRPCAMDAEAFVAVLQRLDPPPRPPAPLRVVVFEGLYGPDHRTCFLDALERQVRESAPPDWIASVETLDVTAFLSAADYFPLDGHLNASGHRKVAGALAARLSRAPVE